MTRGFERVMLRLINQCEQVNQRQVILHSRIDGESLIVKKESNKITVETKEREL